MPRSPAGNDRMPRGRVRLASRSLVARPPSTESTLVHVLLILIVGLVLAGDQLGHATLLPELGPAWVATLTLLPLALAAIAQHVILILARRGLERTGSYKLVVWSDRIVAWTRWWTLLWHGLAVLVLGWVGAVRQFIGHTILIDQALAALPALLMIVAGWFSLYPMDRLLREAVMVRELDEGKPIHAPTSRWAWVWMQVRHQMLLVLVPMAALVSWSELVSRMLAWLIDRPPGSGPLARAAAWLAPPNAGHAEWAHFAAQFVGILAVFSIMPAALRYIWDTAPLAAGDMRDGLLKMCDEHRVRIAGLLVWRTGGTMINGAVLGILGRLRYVLLTDALLESLPRAQIEAVMAHEVGHVRRRHMPWLAAALLASVGATASLGELLMRLPALQPATGTLAGFVDALLVLASLAIGLVLFGCVSRRFEWQADAFAVQHLSGLRTRGPSVNIHTDAVDTMVAALDAVARLNHIPRAKFSWRHGSIERRIANLLALQSLPARALPIDRTSTRIKLATLALIAAQVAIWATG